MKTCEEWKEREAFEAAVKQGLSREELRRLFFVPSVNSEQTERPPQEDLRRYGYAPGWYTFHCAQCQREAIAAKRSVRCLACAREAAAR